MAARLSVLRAGRTLPLVLISIRGRVDSRAIMRLEGLGKLEKIHLIGTRSRDLPACNIVPQPLRYRMVYANVFKQTGVSLVPVWILRRRSSHKHYRVPNDHSQ
jgi:hypothetical protein